MLTGNPESEQYYLARVADRQGGLQESEAVHCLADVAVDAVHAALTIGGPQQEAVENLGAVGEVIQGGELAGV